MNNKKIFINNESFGNDMLLVDVREVKEYVDGNRTDKVIGYAYVVCLPVHGLDKISIKITGKQQIEAPTEGYVAVEFKDLLVRPYVGRDGRLALTATASAIKAVDTKA